MNTPEQYRARGWPLMVAAFTLAFVSSAGQTFFVGLFAGEWQQRFALGHAELGGLYSAATLLSGMLMFGVGGLSDRFSPARYALVTLALLGTGCLLMGLAGPLWLFAIALFLVRFAGQGLSSHLAVTLPAKYRHQRAGRGVAGAHYGHIGGEAMLPPVVVTLVGLHYIDGIWTTTGLLLLLGVLPTLWILLAPLPATLPGASTHKDTGEPPGPEEAGYSRRQVLSEPHFWPALAVVVFPPFLVTALLFHQRALAELRDWPLTALGLAMSLFALVQALSTAFNGRLADRHGSRAILPWQLLPALLALAGLALLPGPPGLFVMFASLGALAGSNAVHSTMIWRQLYGTVTLGRIRGMYAAFMVLGTAAAPLALGLVLDHEVAAIHLLWVLLWPAGAAMALWGLRARGGRT